MVSQGRQPNADRHAMSAEIFVNTSFVGFQAGHASSILVIRSTHHRSPEGILRFGKVLIPEFEEVT